MLQGLIFLAIVLLVVGPIHYYLWRRLVKDTTKPGRWRRAGTIAVIALSVLLMLAFILPRTIGIRTAAPFALVGYIWLAVMFYLLLTLLVLEIPRAVALRRARKTASAQAAADEPVHAMAMSGGGGGGGGGDAEAAGQNRQWREGAAGQNRQVLESEHDGGLSRRLLITRSAAIFAGLTATGITGYGVKTAYGPPLLKRVQIPLAKLPASLDGYRIAVVADVHIGPLTGIEHTRRIVDAINGMDADLITMVGDICDGTVEELHDEAIPLRGLRSRDGTYYVTGNHEYYSGVESWIEEVKSLGMLPLQNERVEIRGLDLAGVNDVTGETYPEGGGGPDYAKALADRDPGKPVVLMAHQPVQAFEAAKYKVDLQLSGHTHGGQMAPFNYIARLQQPVISGLGEVDGTKVYVTNGAGFWGPPVRVGAPPDITLVELRRG